MKINLPNSWNPRDYQASAWNALSSVIKRFLFVWHRRSGKDDVLLHHNACAAFERVGNYWYMLPEYAQCRKAIWDAVNPHTGLRRIDEAFPEPLRKNTINDEMKIVFKNGSSWQLMGSDKFDALVGSPPVGLTFSEYALSNPTSWGYLRPILLENKGWAAFNSTPRGKNHLLRLKNLAQESDNWYFEQLTVDDTGIFTKEQLDAELRELISEHGKEYGNALFLQEYYCSFDAALPGAIWGDATTNLEGDGRLTHVPHLENYPVHSAWDLGRDDDTAVWFYQVVDGDVNIIDFYADNFKDPDFYADYLRDHGRSHNWRMGTHWLPFDGVQLKMGMGGKTILQQFLDHRERIKADDSYDIGRFDRVPSFSKQEGIQAGRKTLKIARFDKTNCEDAFEHLKAYRRKYDNEKKTFSQDPEHDFHSHAADAFRYLSLTWRHSKETQVIIRPDQMINGNVIGMNFGEMKREHMKKMRQQRANSWR